MIMSSNTEAYKDLIQKAAQLWDNEEYHRIQESKNTASEIDDNRVLSEADFLFNIIAQAREDG